MSNDYTIEFLQNETRLSETFSSNKEDKKLDDGEEIEYTLTLKNEGIVDVYGADIYSQSKGIKFIKEA